MNKSHKRPLSSLQKRFALLNASSEFWLIDLNEVDAIKSGKQKTTLNYYKKSNADIVLKRYLEELSTLSDARAVINQFWVSPKTKTYTQIAFSPLTTPQNTLNLWVASTVTPTEGDWSALSYFLKEVICDSNQEKYDYLVNFFAHMLQFPEEKPGVMIVLLGSQGTGKGTLFKLLAKIWEYSTLQVNDVKYIVENFNAAMESKYVICMDEALFVGDKAKLERLKSLVTEPTCRIEEKYQPARVIDSYHRFFAASNSDQFAHVERDDRRFLFLRVSDSKKCDLEYFRTLNSKLNDPTIIAAMVYDLLKIDLTNFSIRHKPNTQEHINQKIQSLIGFDRYWLEVLQSGNFSGRDHEFYENWSASTFIPTKNIISRYVEFDKNANRFGSVQSHYLASQIKKICPSAVPKRNKDGSDKQVRGYLLPDIKIARKEFEQAIGGKIDWGEADIGIDIDEILRPYLIDVGAHP